jgi:RNA polymerase sigma-70 factor, ECF subfamily
MLMEDRTMGQLRAGAADASRVEGWSRRFGAGDETVLGELLAAWAPQMVRRLVWKYIDIFAEDELEQIVLDALFAGWIKRQMFDPEKSSLMTWLDRIVKHLVIDRAKSAWWKQRCRETRLANYKDDEPSDSDFQTVDSGEDKDDPKSFQSPQMSALLQALAGLTPREHNVLLASMDETMSSRDLAQELDIAASTVRTYRQRAWEKVLRALRCAGFRVLEMGNNAGKGKNLMGPTTDDKPLSFAQPGEAAEKPRIDTAV